MTAVMVDSTATVGATAALEARVRELESERDMLALRLRERDDWLERMNADAWDWADRYDLCDRFEAFCSEWGLKGRRSDYDVTVELTVTVPMVLADLSRGLGSSDLAEEISNRYGTDAELLAAFCNLLPSMSLKNVDVDEYDEEPQ